MSDERDGERPHDPTYRRLFGHPQLLRELLEEFVGAAVTGELDLDHPEPVETTFIAASLLRRESDLLWKIPRRGGGSPVYIYVLLELQSRVDPLMAVRMLVYVGLIYERIGREDPSCLQLGGLPPILPIVLYNGATPWRAQVSLRTLIGVEPHAPLAAYQPSFMFYLIDERRLNDEMLAHSSSLLAGLFRLEQPRAPEELRALIRDLARRTRASSAQLIVTDVLIWLNELLRFKGVLLQEEQLHSFQEADEMFDEKMEAWFNKLREEGLRAGMAQGLEQGREQGLEQGREQGLEQGREQGALLGMRKMAGELLQLKFGDDVTRAAWLDGLSGPQLDGLVARIWAADDEAALRAAVASASPT